MRAEPRQNWPTEVGSAASRFLNAVCGGDGAVTVSAGSWDLLIHGSSWGRWRVDVVDWLNRDDGHCREAWHWHRARGLI